MDEQKKQLVKEEAIRQGIELGMALLREGLKIYGMKVDGKKIFICEAKDYDSLWDEALKNIELMTKTENIDKSEEYLNNWKRERADFMNYKKDETKRVESVLEFSKVVMLEDFIEIKDELERALRWGGEPEEHELNTGWREGIKMTLKKFDDILKRYDVERISVEGAFDPLLHEAVEEMEEGGNKLEEIRAGYTMRGKVIRPARVKIIK